MESFYINLLSGENDGVNWEENLESTPIGEQECPVEQPIPSTKPSSKRSKNFNEREDMVLISAWLNISLDAAQGNEQSCATYWRRIHSYFHENKNFDSDHTQSSLVHRWSTIQEHVNKLCGCHDHIERRQSGVTEKDKIIKACALYKEEERKSFQVLHRWNVLQHHPKWTDMLSQKKQKVSISSTPAACSATNSFAGGLDSQGEAPSLEDVSLKRHIGKKAAKTRLRRGQGSCSFDGSEKVYMEALDTIWSRKSEADGVRDLKKDERYERAYALEQERIATEKERLQLKRQEFELRRMVEEEKIMKIDTTTISLRSDIIGRRCDGSD